MDIYQKLHIPTSCIIESTIFKKLFYDSGNLSKSDKDLFKKDIDKITCKYCLKYGTINIQPYKDERRNYPEVEIIEVSISAKVKIKRIAEIIMGSIPYPMVLVFKFENTCQLWTAHQQTNQADSTKNTLEKFIYTNWLEECDILFDRLDITKMSFTNFYKFYSDIVDVISIYNAGKLSNQANLTGEQARQLVAQIQQLDNEIASLKSKIRKETQMNRRIEMNIEIKELEKQREEKIQRKDL